MAQANRFCADGQENPMGIEKGALLRAANGPWFAGRAADRIVNDLVVHDWASAAVEPKYTPIRPRKSILFQSKRRAPIDKTLASITAAKAHTERPPALARKRNPVGVSSIASVPKSPFLWLLKHQGAPIECRQNRCRAPILQQRHDIYHLSPLNSRRSIVRKK